MNSTIDAHAVSLHLRPDRSVDVLRRGVKGAAVHFEPMELRGGAHGREVIWQDRRLLSSAVFQGRRTDIVFRIEPF